MSRQTQSVFFFTFSEETKPRTQSRMITSKSGQNDVVDALKFMRQGSQMIMIENGEYYKWDTYRITPDSTTVINSANQVVIPLAAVESIAPASEISVTNALEIFEMSHLKPEGLENVLFTITLLGGHTVTFVADLPRSCYIWMRGIQALTESTRDLSSIPLMVANRLRSGTMLRGNPNISDDEEETTELIEQRDSIEMFEAEECVSSKHGVRIPQVLSDEWEYFEKEIDSIDRFVQLFCILDSTQHLVLLGDVLRLRSRLNDLESKIYQKNKSGEIFSGWGDWYEIHEQWWLLHADIAITHLRTAELREEVGLKQ